MLNLRWYFVAFHTGVMTFTCASNVLAQDAASVCIPSGGRNRRNTFASRKNVVYPAVIVGKERFVSRYQYCPLNQSPAGKRITPAQKTADNPPSQ